jgi:hypothetical protein
MQRCEQELTGALFDEYGWAVHRCALRLLGDPAQAQEATIAALALVVLDPPEPGGLEPALVEATRREVAARRADAGEVTDAALLQRAWRVARAVRGLSARQRRLLGEARGPEGALHAAARRRNLPEPALRAQVHWALRSLVAALDDVDP